MIVSGRRLLELVTVGWVAMATFWPGSQTGLNPKEPNR